MSETEAMGQTADKQNWVERNSKTIITIATASIPIVLALIGYFTQSAISDKDLSKEYVNLAIGIVQKDLDPDERGCFVDGVLQEDRPKKDLNDEDKESMDELLGQCDLKEGQALRKFAVDLLNENSSVALDADAGVAVVLGGATAAAISTESASDAEASSDADADNALVLFELFQALDEEDVTDCEVTIPHGTDIVSVTGVDVASGIRAVDARKSGPTIIFYKTEESDAWFRMEDAMVASEGCNPSD